MARSLLALSAPLVILAAPLFLGGCSGGGGGCTKDSDCKGDRVCAQGECVDLPTKAAEGPAGPARVAPEPTAQGPSPQPVPVPATPAPGYAADGLPADIPAPGSPPPSVDEWNAVTREVTVKGSSKLNCETKMLREWLRASCRKNAKGEPIEVNHTQQSGQQAFKFVGNGIASVVVQVVRAKTYKAQYVWDRGGAHTGAELIVRWAPGAPRPEMFFTEN